MSLACRCLLIASVGVLLASTGCKEKKPTADAPGASVSEEDIAAVRDTLTRGMTRMALADLKATHVGKKCVVTAHTPAGGYQSTPPPPPPGMVHLLGRTIIYSGEFDTVSDDSVSVRAAYPTAGNYKRIEIPRDDIQSLYLAP